MRRVLDGLYRLTLWGSALCLAIIALMVGVQLAARLIDGALALLNLPRTEFIILSLNEISGYLLAAATFLALAGTLKAGAHIRVTMVLSMVSEAKRRWLEVWAFGFAALCSAYMTGNLILFAWTSFRFNEVSSGVVRVPLVYPQAAMAAGALVLTIALVDEFVSVLRGRLPSFRAAEDAITVGKEG